MLRHRFAEAFETAAPGDVLVVDNGGRLDEASAGDLVALGAQAAGMEGMVIWGLHRDTADIRAIGLPVFSLGAIPTGPSGSTPARDHNAVVRKPRFHAGRDILSLAAGLARFRLCPPAVCRKGRIWERGR
jgi:hypothetical protein